jgi:hypothetical protein
MKTCPSAISLPVTGTRLDRDSATSDLHSLVTIDLIGTAREAVPARSGNQHTDVFDFGDRSGGV